MPNRMLREGILDSEKVDLLDCGAEVFYRRLMSAVDDFGRFEANPKLIRAKCFPLRLDRANDTDVETWLAACVAAGLIDVYRADDGKRYLELLNFRQHTRAKRSKYPLRPGELMPKFHSIAPPRAGPIQGCDADAAQVHFECAADEVQAHSVTAAIAGHRHGDGSALAAHVLGERSASALHAYPTSDAADAVVHRGRDAHAHGDGDGDGDGDDVPPVTRRRGTRLLLTALPTDWEKWASSNRPDLDPCHVWNKFRDYWVAQPGRKGVKSDWLATWRNWVRDERGPIRPQLQAITTGSTGNAARRLA